MKFVEEEISKDGTVLNNDVLKVDAFINHQIDTDFALKIGKAFADEFDFNKVLTIETSGIAFALTTAMNKNNCPVIFAKKSKSAIINLDGCYHASIKSFTRNSISEVMVDKRFLSSDDKILIVDDFLAEGNAALGLIDIVKQSGAKVVGVCSVITKVFQGGEKKINDLGYKVLSGARISTLKDGKIEFI